MALSLFFLAGHVASTPFHVSSAFKPSSPQSTEFYKATSKSLSPSTAMAVLGRFLRARPPIPSSIFSPMAVCAYLSTDCSIAAGSAANSAVKTRGDKEGERKIHWVFLGCPGVGKGTYASRLSRLLGVPHIATGDLVRHELVSSGPLASKLAEIVRHGQLVPDEIIFDLLSKRLEAGKSKGESGFILDGFPRTVRQAEILEGVVDIELVINLKLREEALIAKCLGRRICSECGGNFNVASIDLKNDKAGPALSMAPLLPPPECESKLITRTDDEEEVVKKRLQIYHETTEPVEEFYRKRGKLLEFDLPGGIPESWTKLLQLLHLDDNDHKRSAVA